MTQTVAVVGARGGAGASSFAAALARAVLARKDGARRRRRGVVLVDLARGAGIDVLLGLEESEGARWPDVAHDTDPSGVLARLPTWAGVRVLSRDRARPAPPAAVRAEVVEAIGAASGFTVVDVGPDDDAVLAHVGTVLVLAPRDVRSAAGVLAWRDRLAGTHPDVRLVARGPAPGGLSALELAHVADLPLAAVGKADRTLDSALEHGLGPPPRGALARLAARVAGDL